MRLLVIGLLLANMAFYGWERFFASTVVPPEAVPSDVKPLLLLSERELGKPRPRPAQAPSTPQTICYTVGVLGSEDEVKKVSDRFSQMGITTTERVVTEHEQYAYQIYIPPLPSRADATAKTRELVNKGIKDYYIMTEAGKQNAISLGLFREKRHALRRVDLLEGKGFAVKMESQYRTRKSYWLDFEDKKGIITDKVLRGLALDRPIGQLSRQCG